LYKYKPGIKNEFVKGYSIEKKGFSDVVNELLEQGKNVYVMDKRGEDIRKLSDKEMKNAVFILGDQDGIPKFEMKKLKKMDIGKISVGNQMYFASQTTTIIQNELDRREL
ncbi:MAG: hypothetical protein AABW67_04535, partial [Nanoarchaeota archaeon]